MFGWFGDNKPDHPLADMKKARRLIAELAQQGSIKAIDDASSSINSVISTPGFKLNYRLALINLVDHGLKTHQAKLALEYVATPRMQKPYENRLWNACFGFWKALGSGYLSCIEQFQAGAAGSGTIKRELPLVTARSLRCLALQIKWTFLRYGMVEDRIWRYLGQVYLFAESQGFADRRMAVYPGPHGESSAEEEFVKALMLVMSSPDSLPPDQLHIAERIIARFGPQFALRSKAGSGCTFVFELAMHRPPVRGLERVSPSPMLRFFGPGAAARALHQLTEEVKRKEATPSDLNLGGEYDKSTVLSVLSHLNGCWADKRPVRASPRRDLATRVTVVPGFQDIIAWITAAMDASSLAFSRAQVSESWIVFNVSDGGYGAIVPPVKGDWLHIGNLLGVQPETSGACGVGVVRRLSCDQYGQRRVGIRTMAKAAIPMTIEYAVSGGESKRTLNSGLLLSARPDKNGQITVLMAAASYTPTQNFCLHVLSKKYLLAPVTLLEGGEDFDWARFRVLKPL